MGLSIVLLLLAGTTAAEPGLRVFEEHCASCHSVVAGAGPMPGPNLAGLLGRHVGGDAGFGYSGVLREAGARGETWSEARLRRFLDGPEEMYPGLWMGGTSLREAEGKDALARFLAGR
jgi:cytochrome c